MPSVTPTLLTAAIILAGATGATAQVTKPRNPPPARLPAPSKITSTQRPNGHIHVVWSGVEGAVSYRLTRSVPPVPEAVVSLANPNDTMYLDSDVNPGSTYYYQVLAVNEAGSGLKRSTVPLKAIDPAANRPPDPPKDVRAVQHGATADLSWARSEGAARYLVEWASGATNVPENWRALATPANCCSASQPLGSLPVGSHLAFRVVAESPTQKRSAPARSNEIVIAPTQLADTSSGQGTPADTTTGTPPADTTRLLDAPTNVVAKPYPYMKPTVTWQSAETRARFLVERRVSPTSEWKQIIEFNRRPGFFKCCVAEDPDRPEDEEVVYRVTAVDTVAPTLRSPPVLSNPIVIWKIRMDPPVLHDTVFTVGQSGRIFTPNIPLTGVKWVSLEPQIVTVDMEVALVKALRQGSTYIVASGSTSSGGVQSHIWRVRVDP